MAFLGKGRKQDLQNLASELGVTISPEMKVIEIKTAIISEPGYDEEFVKTLFETILADRKSEEERAENLRLAELARQERESEKQRQERESEKQRQERERESEKQRQERESERQRQERESEKQRQQDLKEKELQLNFELEKLKLGIEGGTNMELSVSSKSQSVVSRLDIRRLIPEFNPNQSDISLYLIIFERQVKRAQIEKENWVAHLLSLLRLDIVQLIAREPDHCAEDYDYIKKLLLQRFKLSPETFRQKFVQHQKKSDSTWKDFTFEIKNYLEEWLLGLGIETFEDLKDLMVTDQLKKRAKSEMKEHFLDNWAIFKSSSKLAELFDNYEDIRKTKPKSLEKFHTNEKTPTSSPRGKESSLGGGPVAHSPPPHNFKGKSGSFEKRVPPRCYLCNSTNHLRYNCPELAKNKATESLNHITEIRQDVFKPYTTKGMVNNHQIAILRDSGASIDLVSRRYINPSSFSGEHIWVKQPLSLEVFCLPLAVVEISGPFGAVKTKTAVCENKLNHGRYILGNRTAALIKEKTGYDFFPVESINAVQNRDQAREINKQDEAKEIKEIPSETVADSQEGSAEELGSHSEQGEEISIPDIETDAPGLALLKIDREDFITAQRKSPGLKSLLGQTLTQQPNSECRTFCLVNGLLVKNQVDKLGNNKRLLVVPERLRNRIKSLCHKGTSAHLGSTKSKDKLNRYFYWPNCYKHMDEFVRTCDECQRAGKPNDKKKTPHKCR